MHSHENLEWLGHITLKYVRTIVVGLITICQCIIFGEFMTVQTIHNWFSFVIKFILLLGKHDVSNDTENNVPDDITLTQNESLQRILGPSTLTVAFHCQEVTNVFGQCLVRDMFFVLKIYIFGSNFVSLDIVVIILIFVGHNSKFI